MVTLYCADWLVPVAAPPIADGAIAVSDSRIDAVGTKKDLLGLYPLAMQRDYAGSVIMPGLVNCHTHLELTGMRGYLEAEEGEFFAWLRKLTHARAELLTPDDIAVCAAWGAVEAARAGITSVGDASDQAQLSLRAVAEVGLRGIVYQEAFGPDSRLAVEQFEKLKEKIARLRGLENTLVQVGVSPHAPYTVSGALLQLITNYAAEEHLPMMMHAAESTAENLFIREGSGPFADGLRKREIHWQATGLSPIAYVSQLEVLQIARPLLAHCVTVDETDLELIVSAGAKIAHCPKSNAKLGHGSAPLAEFLRRNAIVGLGSDSVASNNTCDLLEEARFAALTSRIKNYAQNNSNTYSDVTAEQIFTAATLGGARALSLEHQVGVLAAGQSADFTVVSLNGAHQLPVYDPVNALVFSSSGRDVLLTVVNGREVYREGSITTVDEKRLRARLQEIGRKLSGI